MKDHKRFIFVGLGLFFLFSLLIGRYFQIQIIEGERWSKEALIQHEVIIKEPFRRGTFYSTSIRNREKSYPLAIDVTKYHLRVDSLAIPKQYKNEISTALSNFCSLNVDFVKQEVYKNSRSRKITSWLNKEEKEIIFAWWKDYSKKKKIPINAIYFVTDYKRSYPYGKLLGPILHTIRDLKDEKTLACSTTGGLEAFFNKILEGTLGERKLLRSPRNNLEIDKIIKEPKNGVDIHLTIDHCLQEILEDELEKGVKASLARGGWGIMMDPYTGEILAAGQYPFFSPSNYKDFFNDKEKVKATRFKAITDLFEPGSIMKPITVAIALQANKDLESLGKKRIFSDDEPIDVTRSIFPGRVSSPLKDIVPYKKLNLYMAIQKSSNVYMAQVIDRVISSLGCEWYRQALMDIFFFGKKTGIELPAEAIGFVPSLNKFYSKGAPEWSTSTPYSLAIGYNILVTSLQMARAYSVIVNGGYLIKPTLVKKITTQISNGALKVLFENKKCLEDCPRVLEEDVCDQVKRAMKYTTHLGGTARRAAVLNYTSAGKTGTTEKILEGSYSKKTHIASFIGCSPASFKKGRFTRFVLLITIDEPAYIIDNLGRKNYMGGNSAAPIFSKVAERALKYMGEQPDIPIPSSNKDWTQELRSLKLLFEEWNCK